MEEYWKGFPGYEELYRISSFGRVENIKTGREVKVHWDAEGCAKMVLTRMGKVKCFRMNAVIAFTFLDHLPNSREIVAHIDGDKRNIRADNFKIVSYSQNKCDRPAKKQQGKAGSKYPGVTFVARRGKWRADISLNGKQVIIGVFKTEQEAADAYMDKYEERRRGVGVVPLK